MFVLMPPKNLALKIDDERRTFAEAYKCVKGLKPPVHITLYPPFEKPSEFEEEIKSLQYWVQQQKSFEVTLKDFNFFKPDTSPIIYINVVLNESLNILHKTFIGQLRKYIPIAQDNNEFSPHFTIGYRDIPVALFPEIMKEYSARSFSGSFEVSSIYLWKHDGKKWQILNEFTMGKP